MSSDITASVSSKHAGERAAAEALEEVPGLGHAPDTVSPHYDAVATVTLRPDFDLRDLDAVPQGTRVEIKSAMVVYASGERGRFYFRPSQHDALLNVNGVYLFVVCEPTPDRDILAMTIVSAVRVDDQLPEWFNGGDGRSDYAQLAWSNFVAPAEVSQR
ncbi:hypothetical protein [Halorussus marinus]|uniref:hypothetical protein n=1 Tax=Halorussus marinus TaxID=2505976 RepID=UPI001B3001B4|nr:hypothetical protein [Halorussus marinus]